MPGASVLIADIIVGLIESLKDKDAHKAVKITDEHYKEQVKHKAKGTAGHDIEFKDYAPHVFDRIRKKYLGLNVEEYLQSWHVPEAAELSQSAGRSGSLFYKTQDKKFLLKTILHPEVGVLLSVLKDYFHYLKQTNQKTLIMRLVGLHRLSYGSDHTWVLIFANSLPINVQMDVVFDLKGRRPKPGKSFQERGRITPEYNPKKDNELDRGLLILDDEVRQAYVNQVTQDVHFLATHNLMDYSLLVGVHTIDEKLQTHPEEPQEPPRKAALAAASSSAPASSTADKKSKKSNADESTNSKAVDASESTTAVESADPSSKKKKSSSKSKLPADTASTTDEAPSAKKSSEEVAAPVEGKKDKKKKKDEDASTDVAEEQDKDGKKSKKSTTDAEAASSSPAVSNKKEKASQKPAKTAEAVEEDTSDSDSFHSATDEESSSAFEQGEKSLKDKKKEKDDEASADSEVSDEKSKKAESKKQKTAKKEKKGESEEEDEEDRSSKKEKKHSKKASFEDSVSLSTSGSGKHKHKKDKKPKVHRHASLLDAKAMAEDNVINHKDDPAPAVATVAYSTESSSTVEEDSDIVEQVDSASAADMPKKNSIEKIEDLLALGGILGRNPLTGQREVYFVAIIDCLTSFVLKKKVAYMFKQFKWKKSTLSTVDAMYYGKRFGTFMTVNLLTAGLISYKITGGPAGVLPPGEDEDYTDSDDSGNDQDTPVAVEKDSVTRSRSKSAAPVPKPSKADSNKSHQRNGSSDVPSKKNKSKEEGDAVSTNTQPAVADIPPRKKSRKENVAVVTVPAAEEPAPVVEEKSAQVEEKPIAVEEKSVEEKKEEKKKRKSEKVVDEVKEEKEAKEEVAVAANGVSDEKAKRHSKRKSKTSTEPEATPDVAEEKTVETKVEEVVVAGEKKPKKSKRNVTETPAADSAPTSDGKKTKVKREEKDQE